MDGEARDERKRCTECGRKYRPAPSAAKHQTRSAACRRRRRERQARARYAATLASSRRVTRERQQRSRARRQEDRSRRVRASRPTSRGNVKARIDVVSFARPTPTHPLPTTVSQLLFSFMRAPPAPVAQVLRLDGRADGLRARIALGGRFVCAGSKPKGRPASALVHNGAAALQQRRRARGALRRRCAPAAVSGGPARRILRTRRRTAPGSGSDRAGRRGAWGRLARHPATSAS
jgi:hypothetical protein